MSRLNKETVLSLFLGFVVIWFGVNEVTNPQDWSVFIPKFIASFAPATTLVILHGAVLIVAGISLILNWKRRIASGILALMILSIVITLFSGEGLTEIVVRDIGLLGMALALALKN
jgi:uncharacterized membrane protein YphA (DoxX/SURF4 family)